MLATAAINEFFLAQVATYLDPNCPSFCWLRIACNVLLWTNGAIGVMISSFHSNVSQVLHQLCQLWSTALGSCQSFTRHGCPDLVKNDMVKVVMQHGMDYVFGTKIGSTEELLNSVVHDVWDCRHSISDLASELINECLLQGGCTGVRGLFWRWASHLLLLRKTLNVSIRVIALFNLQNIYPNLNKVASTVLAVGL